ncbi:MAG: hypothetical protein ACI4HO_08770 [Ruminococcus sp.]
MTKSYTYDPSKIGEPGKDRMRFELGDTLVEGREQTAALSDEEYAAVIAAKPSWRRAKLAIVESIMRRFAYEVDEKVGPLSLSLRQRYESWAKIYAQLKKETENTTVPGGLLKTGKLGGAPYFTEGMHNNPENGGTEGGGRLV